MKFFFKIHFFFFAQTDNIKKPTNLHEEIMAMAKTESSGASTPPTNVHGKQTEEKLSLMDRNVDWEVPKKVKKSREKLVQEFRISVSDLLFSISISISDFQKCLRIQ